MQAICLTSYGPPDALRLEERARLFAVTRGRLSQIPPRRPPAPLPREAASACEPHRTWIEEQVGLGHNATAIYQELVERHDLGERLSQCSTTHTVSS